MRRSTGLLGSPGTDRSAAIPCPAVLLRRLFPALLAALLVALPLQAAPRPDCPEPILPDAPAIEALLDWIEEATGYDTSATRADLPQVRFCQRGATIPYGDETMLVDPSLQGAYDPTVRVIFLVRPWDIANLWNRSVLLHELLHAVQIDARPWPCINATETEAYTLQQRWLAEHGATRQFDPLKVWLYSRCPRDHHP